MRTKIFNILSGCFFSVVCTVGQAAVVIPIEAPQKAFLASKDPTMVMFMESEKPADVTLIYIPGGDGRLGFKEGTVDPRGAFAVGIFKSLTRSGFNVVIVDDPRGIDFKIGYSGDDRIDRIESVIKYYHSKLKTPLILFGHSHGSNAVMRFLNRSTEHHSLIAGIVLSSSRIGINVEPEMKLPILFMHHIADACPNTTYQNEVNHFEQLKARKFNVSFVTIEGGEAQSGPACESGYHMYFKSYDKVIEAFQKFLPVVLSR